MQWQSFWGYVLVMSVVTYLIRMLPLTLFKKRINNPFFQSFLYYVPYAVLGAMTIPAVFSSTGNTLTAWAGVIVAVMLGFFGKGLLTVALSACGVAFFVGLFL